MLGDSTGGASANGRNRSTISAASSRMARLAMTVSRLPRLAFSFCTRAPVRAPTACSALPDPFENAHVVRNRRPAHIEEPAQPRILHLEIAGRAGELHGRERVHGDAGRADRMAL